MRLNSVQCVILGTIGVAMATALTFDDLTAKVRRQLQDAEGNYWTDAEIHEYLDEGQLEYARKTRALRGSAPITVKENNETYRLPEDCLEVIRLEDSDGNEITRAVSDEVQRAVGNFRNRSQGVPANASTAVKFAYSDLDGNGLIRLYPTPNPTVEEALVEVTDAINTTRWPQITGGTGGGWVEPLSNKLLVFDTSTLKIYTNQFALTSVSVGLGWTLYPVSRKTQYINGYYFASFFPDGGGNEYDARRVDLSTGAVTVYHAGTATGAIASIFPGSGLGSTMVVVYYDNIDGYQVGTTPTAGFAFTQVAVYGATLPFYKVIRDPADFLSGGYYAINGGKTAIVKLSATGAVVSTIYTGTAINYLASAGGVSFLEIGATIYFADGETLYYYDGTGYRDTGIDMYATATIHSGISASGDNLYVLKSATQINVYNKYDFSLLREVTVANAGDVLEFSDMLLKVGSEIGVIDNPEEGEIYLCDSLAFDQSAGAIVDMESASEDDIIEFDGEEGFVCQVVQTAAGLYCWYARAPKEGIVEVNDPLALTHYALYKCYEKDSDKTAMERAMYHLGQFQNILKRDIRRSSEGFNNARPSVQGYYF